RPGAVERRFRLVKAPLQIALGWLTARAVERVLAPSEATARELARDYRVREVRVVPNVTGGLAASAQGAAGEGEAAAGPEAAGAPRMPALCRTAAHPQGGRGAARSARRAAPRGIAGAAAGGRRGRASRGARASRRRARAGAGGVLPGAGQCGRGAGSPG